jgi:hypothetical protein
MIVEVGCGNPGGLKNDMVGWQYERATLAGVICRLWFDARYIGGQPTTRINAAGGNNFGCDGHYSFSVRFYFGTNTHGQLSDLAGLLGAKPPGGTSERP